MPRNPQLNEQMRSESRQKIITTASALFSKKGFFNVRIAEIAKQAGMSPGNIYWYFPSKEEILKAILADFFATREAMYLEAETLPGSGEHKVRRLIELQINTLEQYEEYSNIYMSIMGHGGPTLLKGLGFDLVAIGGRFHQHIINIFQGAIQEGFLPEQDPRSLVVFFFSFFNGLMIAYPSDWKQAPVKSITQAVLQLLGAPKNLSEKSVE